MGAQQEAVEVGKTEATLHVTHDQLAEAFAEWDRRYREKPDEFMSIVEHLLKSTPATYGESCAVYFAALLRGDLPE